MKANITWLTDNLATGGDLSHDYDEALAQQEDLVAQGVTHILDLRVEDDDTERWLAYSVHYLNLGTNDADGHHIPASLFDKAVEFGREADYDGCKLFVHCHMGVNRGPSAAAAILMDRGMGAIEAFDLIRRKRPQAAVYYLLDAYDAHAERFVRESKDPTKAFLKNRHRVKAHWERVIGDPKVVKHINRYIDTQMRKDYEAFFER